jgi:hypothetical protein
MVEWAQTNLPWWSAAAWFFTVAFVLTVWGVRGFWQEAKQHDRSGR